MLKILTKLFWFIFSAGIGMVIFLVLIKITDENISENYALAGGAFVLIYLILALGVTLYFYKFFTKLFVK